MNPLGQEEERLEARLKDANWSDTLPGADVPQVSFHRAARVSNKECVKYQPVAEDLNRSTPIPLGLLLEEDGSGEEIVLRMCGMPLPILTPPPVSTSNK